MLPSAPITPLQRGWIDNERMQEYAHLAWLRGLAAIPLTLLAQRARAATANAGSIHDAQASIGFSTPLLGDQRAPCWTAERPIGLERKVLPREAASFPGSGRSRWTIPGDGSRGGWTRGSWLTPRGQGRKSARPMNLSRNSRPCYVSGKERTSIPG